MGKAVATPNVLENLESSFLLPFTVYLGKLTVFPAGSTLEPSFHPGSHDLSRFTVLGRKFRGKWAKSPVYNPRNSRAAKPEASNRLIWLRDPQSRWVASFQPEQSHCEIQGRMDGGSSLEDQEKLGQ